MLELGIGMPNKFLQKNSSDDDERKVEIRAGWELSAMVAVFAATIPTELRKAHVLNEPERK